MPSLVITAGRVIDPASSTDGVADVAIEHGKIAAIGVNLPRPAGARLIEAEGCIVAPGLIDPHVHLREPGQEHKETLASGSAAAVAGGFTTVCCMPNTSPALDTPELVRYIYDSASRTAACRVFPVAAASKGRRGEELAELLLMAKAGAVAFSDDGDCVASSGLMNLVLKAAHQAGLAFMQHCQDPNLTRGAAMHAGEIAIRLGLTGWPRVAEEHIVERDIRLNRTIRARYHVQHISSGESVDIVRRARARGEPVSAEATPHHLLLTHEACMAGDAHGYNTQAKVNPPLREASDLEAIRAGVADGTISVLATDHAPHTADEKALSFEDAPFGLVGLETALPLYIEALVTPGIIDWPRLIEMMTVEPARLCSLEKHGLGRLAVGGPADVTVIDPDHEWTIDPRAFAGKSNNTPFDARRVKGRAVATVVAGEIKHSRAR